MSEERLAELLIAWEESVEDGKAVTVKELCKDCPELEAELQSRIDRLRKMDWANHPTSHLRGYKLQKQIGRGGFGQVWRATDSQGKPVALKFVPVSGRTEPVIEFEHPNVLRTLETWEADGLQVLVLELAERTLAERLEEAQKQGMRGIPHDELLVYFRQAADALDALHLKGYQHRDIKPQNLLLTQGILKVGDFGLVRFSNNSVTGHTGTMTAAYAAPEFFEGKTTRHSDQYSLAITYCQLRGGKLPFSGTAATVMAGHLRGKPDLSMLAPEERPAVARALSKRSADRWPSCRDFVDAIGRSGSRRTPIGVLAAILVAYAAGFGTACLVLRPAADAPVHRVSGDKPATRPTSPAQALARPPSTPAASTPAKLPTAAFVFDGKARIVTSVDRFAPVTLEVWVNPASPYQGDLYKYVIGSDIPKKSGIGISLEYKNFARDPVMGIQLLPAPTERGFGTFQRVPHGKWSHLAVAFGTAETVVFIDGKEVDRGPPTANYGGTPFVIGNGGKTNPEHYYVGKMGCVRISKGERYKKEFVPAVRFEPDDSAVVIFDPTKVQDGVALDQSGKGNDGMIQGVTVQTDP